MQQTYNHDYFEILTETSPGKSYCLKGSPFHRQMFSCSTPSTCSMQVIVWSELMFLCIVLECKTVRCLPLVSSASENATVSSVRLSSPDNGIKLIIRPRGEYHVKSVSSAFLRDPRQTSGDGDNRMGKLWMLTEDRQTEVETVGSWDVAEEEGSEEFKLTTDRLAYILIGSCCVLSIVCLLLVLIGLKCYKKCAEKKTKKKNPYPGCIIYPTANCYRIRSYSDAHFCQMPVYNEEGPYPTSTACIYCKGYPYYYKGWKSHRGPSVSTKRNKYEETKKRGKSNVPGNSTLHEQTLDIRGRKTVKRITVLPPAETEEPQERRRGSREKDTLLRGSASAATGTDDNPWVYSRRSLKTKKEIRLNTLTDNERDAWLNCIYLLDELHRCHASSPHLENTDVSTLRHGSSRGKSRRSSQDEQEKVTHPQRVFFSEPPLTAH